MADANGVFRSALAGDPSSAYALKPNLMHQAENGRAVVPFSDPVLGSSPLTIILRTDETPSRYIVIPLNPKVVIPERALGVTALVAPDGRTLAHSDGAERVPPFVPYPNLGSPAANIVASFGEEHLVAATPVPGWPLAAAASSRLSDVLADWHASLPFYIFLILGPVLAGIAVTLYLARHSLDGEYWTDIPVMQPRETPAQIPGPTLRHVLREPSPRTRQAEIIPLHAAE